MRPIDNIKDLRFYEDINGYRLEYITSFSKKYIFYFSTLDEAISSLKELINENDYSKTQFLN